jgi:hypothetical protein
MCKNFILIIYIIMHKISQIIVLIVILIFFIFFFNNKCEYKYDNTLLERNKENFKSNNSMDSNILKVSNNLDYGNNDNIKNIYNNNPSNPMGPSQDIGINQNFKQDVYDNRGYKWYENAKDSKIDEFTKKVDDVQLRNKFERMYMLDPAGTVAKYDITYNKISPNCCPAQYAPPFKITDKDSTNCEFAQKYVANQYSGMNFKDGTGCACITPKQADFYGSRGGNTD